MTASVPLGQPHLLLTLSHNLLKAYKQYVLRHVRQFGNVPEPPSAAEEAVILAIRLLKRPFEGSFREVYPPVTRPE